MQAALDDRKIASLMRPPDLVMRLDRMGAAHPTRLSFLRILLRRIAREHWRTTRALWQIDTNGFGRAVYRVDTPERSYSLVAFSQDLPPERRTDRVIAEAWDTSYVLYDGVPDAGELDRLEANAPRQEAGRYTGRDLVLSRANKSVRLFEEVVGALAAGRQPEAGAVEAVGYLMRTTAVYGNGKFGIADRDRIAGRPELGAPFQAEMLTVWLIRTFTVDLAEHCARARSPESATPLAPAPRRRFGVGNSTGLGMAPFLVKHPVLVHNWMSARETALARVRALPNAPEQEVEAFGAALRAAHEGAARWRTEDALQAKRIEQLRCDLDRLTQVLPTLWNAAAPWDRIYRFAEAELSLEGQEQTVSLLLEPHGALVDDLAGTLAAEEDDSFRIDGSMASAALAALIDDNYGWALGTDYGRAENNARFWYTSIEKLEPRLGERWDEPGGELEQPLAFARDVAWLRETLRDIPDQPVARLVLDQPELRHIVRRVQIAASHPYAEIRDNLVSAAMRPIDLLRWKLAFFGAAQFDPRSDRWLRICLFQGAPFPDEI